MKGKLAFRLVSKYRAETLKRYILRFGVPIPWRFLSRGFISYHGFPRALIWVALSRSRSGWFEIDLISIGKLEPARTTRLQVWIIDASSRSDLSTLYGGCDILKLQPPEAMSRVQQKQSDTPAYVIWRSSHREGVSRQFRRSHIQAIYAMKYMRWGGIVNVTQQDEARVFPRAGWNTSNCASS